MPNFTLQLNLTKEKSEEPYIEKITLECHSPRRKNCSITKIVSNMVRLINAGGEIEVNKKVKSFFRLFSFCTTVSSPLIDSFVKECPTASQLKKTYEVVRLILEKNQAQVVQEISKAAEELDYGKIAKHAAAQMQPLVIRALLDRTCDDADKQAQIITACSKAFLTKLRDDGDELLVQMVITCIYWGKYKVLDVLLQLYPQFDWDTIDIEMGEIFELLCNGSIGEAGSTLRVLTAHGYNPLKPCGKGISFYSYALDSNNRILQKFFIDEVLFEESVNTLVEFLFELFKDKPDLVGFNDLEFKDPTLLLNTLRHAEFTKEQFTVLFPLVLTQIYPLNSKRPTLDKDSMSALFERWGELYQLIIQTIPANLDDITKDTLESVKFLVREYYDENVTYIYALLNQAVQVLPATSKTRVWIFELLSTFNQSFYTAQEKQKEVWSIYRGLHFADSGTEYSPPSLIISKMHHVILYGNLLELTGFLNLYPAIVNNVPFAKEEHVVFSNGNVLERAGFLDSFPNIVEEEHAVFSLVRERRGDTLLLWLERGGNPNLSNSHGETLLGIACHKMYFEIINILIKAGAYIQPHFMYVEDSAVDRFSLMDLLTREQGSLNNKDKVNTLYVLLYFLFGGEPYRLEIGSQDKKSFEDSLKRDLVVATFQFLGLNYGCSYLINVIGEEALFQIIYGDQSYLLRRYIYQADNGIILKQLNKFKYSQELEIEKKLLQGSNDLNIFIKADNYIEYLYHYTFRRDSKSLERLVQHKSAISQRIREDTALQGVSIRKLLAVISKLIEYENVDNFDFEELWDSFQDDELRVQKFTLEREIDTLSDISTLLMVHSEIARINQRYSWMEHVITEAQLHNVPSNIHHELDRWKARYHGIIEASQNCLETLKLRIGGCALPGEDLLMTFSCEDNNSFVETLIFTLQSKNEEERQADIENIASTAFGQNILFELIITCIENHDDEQVDASADLIKHIIALYPTIIRAPRFQGNSEVASVLLTHNAYLDLLLFLLERGYRLSADQINLNSIHLDENSLTAFDAIIQSRFNNSHLQEIIDFLKALNWDNYEMGSELARIIIIHLAKLANPSLEKAFACILFKNQNHFKSDEIAYLLSIARKHKAKILAQKYNSLVWNKRFGNPWKEISKVFPNSTKLISLQHQIITWVQDPSRMRFYRKLTQNALDANFFHCKLTFLENSEDISRKWIKEQSKEAETTDFDLMDKLIRVFKQITLGQLLHFNHQPLQTGEAFKKGLFAFLLQKQAERDTKVQNRALWVLQKFSQTDVTVESILRYRIVHESGPSKISSLVNSYAVSHFARRPFFQPESISISAKMLFHPLISQQTVVEKRPFAEWNKRTLIAWGQQNTSVVCFRAQETGCIPKSDEGDFSNHIFLDSAVSVRARSPLAYIAEVDSFFKTDYKDELASCFSESHSTEVDGTESVISSQFAFFRRNICKAVNKAGESIFLCGGYNIATAYFSVLQGEFRETYKNAIQDKLDLLEKNRSISCECLFRNKPLRSYIKAIFPAFLDDNYIRKEIAFIEVVKDMLRAEFKNSLHFLRGAYGIDQSQLDRYITGYLSPLPNGVIILHSHTEAIQVLEIALNEIALNPLERDQMSDFLGYAKKFQEDEESELDELEKELTALNFNVIRVPGYYISNEEEVNYFPGHAGTQAEKDYYECECFDWVPAEAVLRDAFTLYLKKLCRIDKIFFLKDKGLTNSVRT
ncbi:MAG: hypothetical protein WC222_09695 [Parachlamydiales bacterium]|jgi:hypothetical protein